MGIVHLLHLLLKAQHLIELNKSNQLNLKKKEKKKKRTTQKKGIYTIYTKPYKNKNFTMTLSYPNLISIIINSHYQINIYNIHKANYREKNIHVHTYITHTHTHTHTYIYIYNLKAHIEKPPVMTCLDLNLLQST